MLKQQSVIWFIIFRKLYINTFILIKNYFPKFL